MPKLTISLLLIFLFSAFCTGCKKSTKKGKELPGTSYVIQCFGPSVACKGERRKFQRTVCITDRNKLKEEQKKAQKKAQQIFTVEGTCTKNVVFKCHINSFIPNNCK